MDNFKIDEQPNLQFYYIVRLFLDSADSVLHRNADIILNSSPNMGGRIFDVTGTFLTSTIVTK